MKTSALQLTKAYIHDHKQYIDGNVAEHLASMAENSESGYIEYLTGDEISEYETNVDMHNHYEETIVNFIYENFDYDISKFEF